MKFTTVWYISPKGLFLLQKRVSCARTMTTVKDGGNNLTPLYIKNTVVDFVTNGNGRQTWNTRVQKKQCTTLKV